MKLHRVSIFAGLLTTAVLLVAGCKPPPEPAPPPKVIPAPEPVAPDLIAAAFPTLDDPFSGAIRQAMKEGAAAHGYEFLSVAADSDAARQRLQVREFIAREVKAIAIHPCGPTAIGAAIREAHVAGIPVFTFRLEGRDTGARIVSHIGANEVQGGRLAGEAMLEAIGESGGEILIIDARPEDSCVDRIRGFREVTGRFNASRPSSEASLHIAAEISGNGTLVNGFRTVSDALPRHPHIVGIFAAGDSAGLGAAAALEKAGKQDQATVIAFGGSQEARRAIRDGRIYASPSLSPEEIGRTTIDSIVQFLDGKKIPPHQWIDYRLYRLADAGNDPELK